MAWKKGQSGNPGGRSKARQELGDAFIRVLRSDWEEHGAATVHEMRQKDPVAYVKVVAAMLPAQVEHEIGEGLLGVLAGLNDGIGTGATPGVDSPLETQGPSPVCH